MPCQQGPKVVDSFTSGTPRQHPERGPLGGRLGRFMGIGLVLLALGGCRKPGGDVIEPETPGDGTIITDPNLLVDEDEDGYNVNEDCDDGNPAVNPGMPEIVYDGFDNDCNPATPDDDLDYDGVMFAEDCDDEDPARFPGNPEICDGVDNDCNTLVDDGAGPEWHVDHDRDGFGDPGSVVRRCEIEIGLTDDASDCDDRNGEVFPGADELCNDLDDDCDGEVDEEAIDAVAWFADVDGDSFGDALSVTVACVQPVGTVTDDLDCDDNDQSVRPGAVEVCDGIDNDCDTVVDADAVDRSFFYEDADADGYGREDVSVQTCAAPSGYVDLLGDCDDGEAAANPGASEICDAIDNDCDGLVDEAGATGSLSWYRDLDGDGHGDVAQVLDSCTQPAGYVTDSTDCNDTVPTIFPGATEVCDTFDNDCDGAVDEGAAGNATWYEDADGDGFGDDTVTQESCQPPTGYVAAPGDCDDAESTTFPGAVEYCDGDDNNCNGTIDEDGAADAPTWYADADADGFGGATLQTVACTQPTGFVDNPDDCNDIQSTVHPDADELCDSLDNDCDGLVDEQATDQSTWYLDADADGFGDASSSLSACEQPSGYVDNDEDCNDVNAWIRPTSLELCNGVDDDCDGDIDVDPVNPNTFYIDADGDGHGEASTTIDVCDVPAGYAETYDDCDDTNSGVYPDATELCDGIDNDCDGTIDEAGASNAQTWYADDDGDGFGNPYDTQGSCTQPAGYVADDTDCDDGDAAVNPDADEVCNDADDDCDGTIDEDATDASTWFADADGDAYGDATDTLQACDPPLGYVVDATDCDDGLASVNPGRVEICDGLDNDCDGDADGGALDASTWYADADGDGHGDATTTQDACDRPVGHVAGDDDCDDASAAVFPGATEVCDGIDNDCDGTVDDGATDASAWYTDGDGDGYGAGTPVLECVQPSGTSASDDDCDDVDSGVNPGATEQCGDAIDNDCDGDIDEDGASGSTDYYRDIDGDGYGDAGEVISACDQPDGYVTDDTDCDDLLPSVYPSADEVCDGLDNDCDDEIDEDSDEDATWYADDDNDGFGDDGDTTTACEAPDGYVAAPGDCDDDNASVFPGADEYCDDVDNDCDDEIDEGASDATTWYQDFDGDGFGGDGLVMVACEQPDGFEADSTDCDDAEETTHPDADELCDGADNDCDDEIDEDATDLTDFHQDVDGDGYGNAAVSLAACEAPVGYVEDATDCDDGRSTVRPGGIETCNNRDDDCDGTVDEDAINESTFFEDADGDGYGIASSTVDACEVPSGFAEVSGDCDDSRDDVAPDAGEYCDAVDNDCDGTVDEDDAIDALTWYADNDADGFGNPNGAQDACDQPTDHVANSGDCNDSLDTIHPSASEICDGLDNDCNSLVDDGAGDATTWYADGDGDGFGDLLTTQSACSQPSGYLANAGDCDDADAAVNPSEAELCDGLDNDCDNVIDDGALDATVWWIDADGDGYGLSGSVQVACDQPSGYVDDNTDCDDGSATVHPAAVEICDDIDNDCSGQVDDDATNATTWSRDGDGDGYGNPNIQLTRCDQPVGYIIDASDCNDASGAVYPGATELCDGLDNDCDTTVDENATGAFDWYADDDGDFFGDALASVTACSQPSGYVLDDRDCDDVDAAVNPIADEVCDDIDNDCDGSVDVGASDATTWYADGDGDGYGAGNSTLLQCDQPSGYVDVDGDCNDGSAAANPDETEVCDGIDNDCDGEVDIDADNASTYYRDGDADGYGDATFSVDACVQPANFVTDSTDCNDSLSTANPGASEVCDGVDNDCDGAVDNGASGNATWYIDSDGDGFGSTSATQSSCTQPSGYVLDDRDCDDADADISPAEVEVCDDVDNNCDGDIDEDAQDASAWYTDADADGFGTGEATFACEAPADMVEDATDCNDGEATTNPGADEVCDNVDNDCDGLVDDDATDAATWYRDADGDTHGNPSFTRLSCTQPTGFVATSTDCLDSNAGVNPDESEVCDGLDNDCNGTADDGASDATTWYADADGDAYGDAGDSQQACAQPPGYVLTSTDCDDTDLQIKPNAVEVCDDVDNNCDGTIDTDAIDRLTWYTDADGDDFGDALGGLACDLPANASLVQGDCDDGDATSHPGADEVCDDADNDCDGIVDGPNPVGASVWYLDFDEDGHAGDGVSLLACEAPSDYYATYDDCDDGVSTVYPGASEICDGLDNDCDGTVDEGVTDAITFYLDGDGDGFGGSTGSLQACVNPGGYVGTGGDCDDADVAVHPGADELCNTIDDDCDGETDEASAIDASTWYRDADGDAFGDAFVTQDACDQPAGYVTDHTDCDDLEATSNPAADEICDGEDNDCDLTVDEDDAVDAALWFRDHDWDGHGLSGDTTYACEQPIGYVPTGLDCDDYDGGIHPDAAELCDGDDNDCDGTVDEDSAIDADIWYADDDGDGFGDPASWRYACSQPSGYVDDDEDCHDGYADVNPNGTETCNGLDDDCSGFGDDGTASCPCNVHWEQNTGRPYMFCTTAEPWSDARSECYAYDYTMLSVNDAYEDIFANGVADTYSNSKWWIGLNDIDTEGTFEWENGDDVDFENWHSGEPNNLGNEDCTQYNRWGDHTWNDEPCSSSFRYICEYNGDFYDDAVTPADSATGDTF